MSKYSDLLFHFGSNLKRVRSSKKLSQAALSERLGTGRTTINNWEKGVASPTLEMFVKLCRTLDVDADDLLIEKSTILNISAEKDTEYKVTHRENEGGGRKSDLKKILDKMNQMESRIKKLEEHGRH